MVGNAAHADRATLARNGRLGALVREAQTTQVQRTSLARKGQQGLRDKYEHEELDPTGRLRATNPAKLEALIDKRIHLRMSEIASHPKRSAKPAQSAPVEQPVKIGGWDCKECAREQGRGKLPDTMWWLCRPHMFSMFPVDEIAGNLYTTCKVLLTENADLRRELATAS